MPSPLSRERIPERVITGRLGISRTPLREALKILEVQGIVRISPDRGAEVVRLSLGDVAIIEMLIGMELQAAELACQRATEVQLTRAQELHQHMTVACRKCEPPRPGHRSRGRLASGYRMPWRW